MDVFPAVFTLKRIVVVVVSFVSTHQRCLTKRHIENEARPISNVDSVDGDAELIAWHANGHHCNQI
jgi:hypothetical protein